MDYSSDSGDEQIPEKKHHHSFLTELGHAAEDIGKGVATAGISAVLF